MAGSKVPIRLLTAILIAVAFVPAAALAQSKSPVAPTREQVEATAREAFLKFQSDTTGKNADYIPYHLKLNIFSPGSVGLK